jgi:hypothetical protein
MKSRVTTKVQFLTGPATALIKKQNTQEFPPATVHTRGTKTLIRIHPARTALAGCYPFSRIATTKHPQANNEATKQELLATWMGATGEQRRGGFTVDRSNSRASRPTATPSGHANGSPNILLLEGTV